MKHILIFLIRIYKAGISPYFPPSCRYSPTCSSYAMEAIRLHGSLKGSYLAAKRILSCHPWSEGGYDPVPGSSSGCSHESGESATSNEQQKFHQAAVSDFQR